MNEMFEHNTFENREPSFMFKTFCSNTSNTLQVQHSKNILDCRLVIQNVL